MNLFRQIQAQTLREQVADQIRTAIIEGRLKPNDHITEAALTQQLGVSRTPVREAFILLEREALIVSHPNRGCFVRAFNESDVEALFSMRTTLENFAAEINIDRFDEDDYRELERLVEEQKAWVLAKDFKRVRSTDMAFHQYLINATEHPMLMRSWEEIVAQVAAVLYIRAEAIVDYDEQLAMRDHGKIIQAYRSRSVDAVRAENRRINARVAGECVYAVTHLRK
jgi:DNA-binding GntR family transcriptional regulator